MLKRLLFLNSFKMNIILVIAQPSDTIVWTQHKPKATGDQRANNNPSAVLIIMLPAAP